MLPNMPAIMLGDDLEQRQKLEGFRKAWAVAEQHGLTPYEMSGLVQYRYGMMVYKERADAGVFPYPKCVECAHVLDMLPPRLYCMAPQLNDVIEALEDEGDFHCLDCETVRSFKTGCGIEARWFHKRYHYHYSHVSEDWATAGPEDLG